MKKTVSRALLALSMGLTIILGPGAINSPAQARDLVSIMEKDVGAGRPGGCPSKWCACYMNLVLSEAGHVPLGSNRARDFSRYGKKAAAMTRGAIMVMPHHVGVVAGKCPDGRVLLISGNHSRKVGKGCYNPKKAIAWRKPGRG